jgi:DNA-binding NtrC family response regulator
MLRPTSIVLFGQNESLLETRRLLLSHAGFQVSTVKSLAEAEKFLFAHPRTLLVLCHSLTPQDCEEALEMAHFHQPAVKCLAITASTPVCALGEDDEVYSAFEGPANLVATVKRLLDSDIGRKPPVAGRTGQSDHHPGLELLAGTLESGSSLRPDESQTSRSACRKATHSH